MRSNYFLQLLYIMANHYTHLYKYINNVQIHQNYADPVVGDLNWSIRGNNHKGWLLCNGNDIEISRYSELFKFIGNSFGTAVSGDFFKLPDVRGRVTGGIGLGSGLTNRVLGNIVGAERHTLTTAEMPSHTHSITDAGHSHSYNTYTGSVLSTETVVGTNVADDNTSSQTTALSTTGITVNATGDGQSHNNMQPTLFLGNVFIFSGNFFDE